MRLTAILLLLALARATASAQDLTAVIVGGQSTYQVKAGDTLSSIGARLGVTTATLIELNPRIRPNALSAGDTMLIDNTHIAAFATGADLTINVPQRMLFHAAGDRLTAYPVTVGRRSWPTPVGAFTVLTKEIDPAWDVPVSIQREMAAQGSPVITRMEPSPLNPLGTRWIGLSLPGLGIHGTNTPSSIFKFASHGCLRMHPDDIVDLFERVKVGATGVLTYRPVIVAAIDGRLWLEAHPDEYRRAPGAARAARERIEQSGLAARADWTAIDRVLRERRGRAVDVTRPE